MKTKYRQGNLVFYRIDRLPITVSGESSEKTLPGGHKLSDGEVYVQDKDGEKTVGYIVAYNNCEIEHKDYKTLKILLGVYRVKEEYEN